MTGVWAMSEERETMDWHGCYSEGWQNEIVPEAFSHPAKFSRGLIRRIYEHALERGYLKEGQTVLDPFGGVALGAVDTLANGLNFIGIELEQNFVDLGGGCDCTGISKADWVRCIGRPGRWKRFAHKDGRHWCPRCLAEADGVIEPRPPTLPGMEPEPTASYVRSSGKIPHTEPHRYAGNLDLFAKHARNGATAVLVQGDSRNLIEVLEGARAEGIISSPPYAKSMSSGQSGIDWTKTFDSHRRNRAEEPFFDKMAGGGAEMRYGTDPAQLGNMPTGEPPRGIVSSPPWYGTTPESGDPNYAHKFHGDQSKYSIDPTNLGNQQGKTFWAAAKTILLQCHQVLAPGGVAIFVTKRFVRDKQIVEFSQQWADLCQSCGFELVEWIKAWLVEEHGTQYDLTGEAHTKTIKRFSFFRRLHAQKYPHLAIEWEDVLIFRKGKAA